VRRCEPQARRYIGLILQRRQRGFHMSKLPLPVGETLLVFDPRLRRNFLCATLIRVDQDHDAFTQGRVLWKSKTSVPELNVSEGIVSKL
jgi:hypothetical protein